MLQKLRSRRGVSAVEAALVLPLLFLMLFAVMDWSWSLYHWLTIGRASHACVRIASGLPSADDPAGTAAAAAADWLEDYGVDSTAANIDARLEGETLVCAVTYDLPPLIGLVPLPAQLQAQAESDWYGHVFDD